MRLLLSSVLLGLVWFTATNAAASAVAWLLGRVLIRRPSGAGLLLAVRLLPAAASTVFVGAVFLPTHWRLEPVESDESFGVVLSVIAAIGLSLAVRGLWRAIRAGFAGRRFAAVTRRAVSLPGDAVESPIRVVDALPGVSLFGIWRPRILIGSDARRALTPAELDLAISHEVAHRRSQDNLKRFLILLCAGPVLLDARGAGARGSVAGRSRVRGRRPRGKRRQLPRAPSRVCARQGRSPRAFQCVGGWVRGDFERLPRPDTARNARAAPVVGWSAASCRGGAARLVECDVQRRGFRWPVAARVFRDASFNHRSDGEPPAVVRGASSTAPLLACLVSFRRMLNSSRLRQAH